MSVGEAVETEPSRRRPGRAIRFALTIGGVLLLLFGVPWWTLLASGNDWPTGVFVAGTVVFAVALAAFPFLMFLGHGRHHRDGPSVVADTMLGVVWQLFVWSIAGQLLRLVLAVAGVDAPDRSRIASAAALVVSVVLLLWGFWEARRVPRVRRVEVVMPRLGPGLDGLRLVLLTDTHYGPIERSRWSRRVTEVVNTLDADVVAHTGDIADGEVAQRLSQAAPLADIRASMARVYVTGNHEYFSGAQRWVEHMASLGWEALHNRHLVVTRDGASLVIAGVDDRTAAGSGVPGHHADHEAALEGADPALPVLLLAHQPAQIPGAVAHGVDLQISGHTHGGQMWPFHFLVRLDQPVLQGLSRHSERTQLYTSRGTGFWGPPFRIFAPSEITLLTLRTA
ncbi:metallophosphoesterase [Actinoplanes sp. LDG1-06]|uniref:Metallophosphoesterase n=1 Tax=Paractinoplanes ovalisporus TaxID=2810368 RepID=A0ABS2AS23_9ACTN|nr:metallophosphoesterase [Actinoplanes ovalisporus]MBM2622640.1 metallophosphoesterase [Actinoplanes ovalisporus]